VNSKADDSISKGKSKLTSGGNQRGEQENRSPQDNVEYGRIVATVALGNVQIVNLLSSIYLKKTKI